MNLSTRDIDRIIEMAWEDRTPFEAITFQFGLKEQEVIDVMRREMKPSSFRMWRERVQGRATKHKKLRTFEEGRFKCSRQRTITNNSITKR
ncbi:TIGR03643 family protein [uncultured Winogradskyella sp.]|uniref:TIGR03643 family protein n=1 Tax=uncultured Winogradskyella sp. TaxID=395353 RepID=UPI002636C6F1|nr:TIGR03643 family protein [uncultured Winogradskyella sp.]